jgi:hypothetical protein
MACNCREVRQAMKRAMALRQECRCEGWSRAGAARTAMLMIL